MMFEKSGGSVLITKGASYRIEMDMGLARAAAILKDYLSHIPVDVGEATLVDRCRIEIFPSGHSVRTAKEQTGLQMLPLSWMPVYVLKGLTD